MTKEEQRIKVRNILQDFYRRGDYELEQAEEDIMGLIPDLPPAGGAEKSCLNCRFHNSPTYHDKMWCRDCQQLNHYELKQLPAEGAEEIEYLITAYVGKKPYPIARSKYEALNLILDFIKSSEFIALQNKQQQPTVEGAEEYIKIKYPQDYDEIPQWHIDDMQEFATLHAQRIADKMVNQSIDKRINEAVKNEDVLNKMNCLIGYLERWCKNPQSYPPVELESVINEATEYLKFIE